MQTAWWRIAKIIVGAVVAFVVGYHFQPMIENNLNAIDVIVTIFSILAGFLIAIITFIVEPTLQQARTWEELQKMRNTIERKLFRHKVLFFLYLLTLGAALIMYLTPSEFVEVLRWLQVLFLALATFVFLASFSLPGSLTKIQMERYELALEETRPAVIKKAIETAKQTKMKRSQKPGNDELI